jgi:hypothetical protein
MVALAALAIGCSSSDQSGGRDGAAPGDDARAEGLAWDVSGADGRGELAGDVATDLPGGADAPADPGAHELPPAGDTSGDVPVGVPCDLACGLGDVTGRVCAPDSKTYVTHAKVWVDAVGCDGQPVRIETLSGYDGTYTLKHVPCGTWTVHIEKGSFTHYLQAQVETGKVTDLSNQGIKMCLGATAARLCVITGDWDTIEQTLQDLGFQFELYELYTGGFQDPTWEGGEAVGLLTDLSAMQAACDVLFLDCGKAHCEMVKSEPSIQWNLRDFVEAGGSLYASDFAYCYGEYAFPEYIDFHGDDLKCGQYDGTGPIKMDGNQTIEATVLDPDLVAYLGKSTFPAKFGLGPLVSVDGAGLSLAHVQGYVKKFDAVQPFVLSYAPFGAAGGTVLYTSFHNDEQVNADMAVILNYMVFSL